MEVDNKEPLSFALLGLEHDLILKAPIRPLHNSIDIILLKDIMELFHSEITVIINKRK